MLPFVQVCKEEMCIRDRVFKIDFKKYFITFGDIVLYIDLDGRCCGKIKALGATNKQMKQLIFREGIFLTIFSIPVGLLLGFLIAKCGFNWLVEQGNLVSTGTGSMGVQNRQMPLFSLPVIDVYKRQAFDG